MIDFARIKDIREDNDLSQEDISKILGVNRSTYSMWETGINIMSLKYLYNFAQYFNYSIDYVLGLTNDRNSVKMDNDLDFQKLGNNMRIIRIKNGLYQKDIAKLLKVKQSNIAKYEKGLIPISTANLYKFCKTFNISFCDIVNKEFTLE